MGGWATHSYIVIREFNTVPGKSLQISDANGFEKEICGNETCSLALPDSLGKKFLFFWELV